MEFAQIKLTEGKLLDSNGSLNQAGYATSLIKEYDRKDIKASKLRIKEWDYYYVGNKRYGIALTISDIGYISLLSVSVINFLDKWAKTKSKIVWFPLGKTNLPSTSKIGNCGYSDKDIQIKFLNDGKNRHLICKMKNFDDSKDFSCDIVLIDEPSDSMVIATPFKKKNQFYYNQKIVGFKSIGKAKIGTKDYFFDDDYSFAVLDWGRGVWPYKNTWYWSTMCGVLDSGSKVAFNLGYGFGDNTNATENMIFLDGKAYKTEQVTFHIPLDKNGKEDFLQKWTYTSSDGKINLTFTPILNRYDSTNYIVLKSIANQVFGIFNGTLVIDDEEVVIEDMYGFSEKVINNW